MTRASIWRTNKHCLASTMEKLQHSTFWREITRKVAPRIAYTFDSPCARLQPIPKKTLAVPTGDFDPLFFIHWSHAEVFLTRTNPKKVSESFPRTCQSFQSFHHQNFLNVSPPPTCDGRSLNTRLNRSDADFLPSSFPGQLLTLFFVFSFPGC